MVHGARFLANPERYIELNGKHKKTVIIGGAKTDCGRDEEDVAVDHGELISGKNKFSHNIYEIRNKKYKNCEKIKKKLS